MRFPRAIWRVPPTVPRGISLPILAAAAALFVSAAAAAPGDLDPAFGTDGKVTTSFGGITEEAHAVVLQPDGKLVAAGFTSGPTLDFALARYNPDGSLDPSFGDGGKVVTGGWPGNFGFINALVLRSDGKLVAVGGTFGDEFVLARYNPDGSLDQSFGDAGRVVTPVGFGAHPFAAAQQADGKILIVGQLFGEVTPVGFDVNVLLLRYNADGSLDSTFGTGGRVITNHRLSDIGTGVGVQPDGKIVIVGTTSDGGQPGGTFGDFLVARYNTDGSLDPTFGAGGKVVTNISDPNGAPQSDTGSALVLQSDGNIVAAGTTSQVGCCELPAFAVARYNADGSPDASFGSSGVAKSAFADGFFEVAVFAAAAQPNGKLVVAGSRGFSFPPSHDFALMRFDPSGSLDQTFGNAGAVATDFAGADDVARALVVQSDGNLVAAGFSSNTFQGGVGQFALVRYLAAEPQLTASEMIVALISKVRRMLNRPELAGPAVAHLQAALDSLVERRPAVACNALSRFITAVNQVPAQLLSAAQKQELISDANAIRAKIGC